MRRLRFRRSSVARRSGSGARRRGAKGERRLPAPAYESRTARAPVAGRDLGSDHSGTALRRARTGAGVRRCAPVRPLLWAATRRAEDPKGGRSTGRGTPSPVPLCTRWVDCASRASVVLSGASSKAPKVVARPVTSVSGLWRDRQSKKDPSTVHPTSRSPSCQSRPGKRPTAQ